MFMAAGKSFLQACSGVEDAGPGGWSNCRRITVTAMIKMRTTAGGPLRVFSNMLWTIQEEEAASMARLQFLTKEECPRKARRPAV